MHKLNRQHLELRDHDDVLSARIRSYELAFRMQSKAPEVVDLQGESRATLSMYGIDQKETQEFGSRCLLARRMVERGVRFVQLYSGDTNGWDAHSDVDKNHSEYCQRTDKPVAGLLKDLKQRGLLEDTLVIWGGEFGRMPMSEQGKGRDHNPGAFTAWMAGGGIRGGTAFGETDDLGFKAAVDPCYCYDLHATALHLLGLNHTDLTYRYAGRDFRLTDVYGRVVEEVIA